MRRQALTLIAVSTIVVGTQALAQSQRVLHARIDAQFLELSASARDAFDGLLLYPKEVRDACLALSQYPEIVVRLNVALRREGLPLDHVLQNCPLEARTAARVLATAPDVLRIMEDNLVVTGLVGMVYSDDPAFVGRIVDRMAEDAQSAYTVVVDAWVNRLSVNVYAAHELRQAAVHFAQEVRPSYTTVDVRVDGEFGFGFSIGESTTLEVYYTPSYRQTEYILTHADRYPNLADEIVFHYQHHHDHCMSDLRDAFDDWYRRRGAFYGEDFWRARDRAKRLADSARFERHFSQVHQGRAVSAAERNAFLRSNTGEYPHLRGFAERDRNAGARRVIASRETPREFPTRSASERPGVGKAPVGDARRSGSARDARGSTGGKRRAGDSRPRGFETQEPKLRVTRKNASRDQQLKRGERSHRGSWKSSRNRKGTERSAEDPSRTKRTP